MKIILLILIAAVIFVNCSDSKEKIFITETSIEITDVWARPGVEKRNTGAFMIITNKSDSDDTLFAASSSLSSVTEIHETFTRENDIKGMRHIEHIIIPKNSTVELQPGGFHIMLIGLNERLPIGSTGNITLQFKKAGSINLDVIVK